MKDKVRSLRIWNSPRPASYIQIFAAHVTTQYALLATLKSFYNGWLFESQNPVQVNHRILAMQFWKIIHFTVVEPGSKYYK